MITYRITLEKKGNRFVTFSDYNDAVNYVRGMMENGNRVFMGSTGKTAAGAIILRWMDWSDEVPRVVTKSVSPYNPAKERKHSALYEMKKRHHWAMI